MDAVEATRRIGYLERIEQFFRLHEGEWIDARTLETVAGRCAWRTRVSDLRTKKQMHIDNRQQRITMAEGFAILSEYRYLRFVPLGPDASTARPRLQRSLPL